MSIKILVERTEKHRKLFAKYLRKFRSDNYEICTSNDRRILDKTVSEALIDQ